MSLCSAKVQWSISRLVSPDTGHISIVATIGPAVYDPAAGLDRLEELVEAGVAVFRINLSHVTEAGAYETDDAGQRIRTRKYSYADVRSISARIRQIEEKHGVPLPVMLDTKGPEIRVAGLYEPATVSRLKVNEGEALAVWQQGKAAMPAGRSMAVVYDGTFFEEARKGNRIRIHDGRVELLITDKDYARRIVTTQVISGDAIETGKSINLPNTHLGTLTSPITDADRADIGQCFDADLIAQSFVRSASDIENLQTMLELYYGDRTRNPNGYPLPKIIAKIETEEAVVENQAGEMATYLQILEHDSTFGVMIARGDLGGECGIPKVPGIQERLLDYANRIGKPAIVATQMLESMIAESVPTRAEAQDVYSAVKDGADAVMLSGETANGRYPVRSVEQMKSILRETRLDTRAYRSKFREEFVFGGLKGTNPMPEYAVDVIGYAIVTMAEQARSPFIISYATKAWSAARIARFRVREPTKTLVLTIRPQVARNLRLLYGVCPILLEGKNADGAVEDLPRERGEVIALARRVIGELVQRFPDLVRQFGEGWEDRFLVATLADKKPEYWDVCRELLVFKYRE